MRINIICAECSAGNAGHGIYFIEEIRDDGLYMGRCPVGHEVCVGTQTLRHEMLFEIALNALVDGYRREAVASFAAAVERFYEFALEVISDASSLDSAVFDAAWKEVAAQSERQLGGFVLAWTLQFKRKPSTLSADMTQLRNSVIHKGVLPDRSQAREFGRHAYEIIQTGIRDLRDAHINSVYSVLGRRVAKVAEGMVNQYPRSFQVTPTAINLIDDYSNGFTPFDEILRQRGL